MGRFPAIAILLLASLARSAQGAEIDLGGLRIDWPDGYTEVGQKSPIQLAGPNGVVVLITVWNATPKAGANPAAEASAVFSNIAESRLPKLAAVEGNVILPLQRKALPNGSVIYSTATQAGSRRKPRFYLQYMLVAPSSRAALFTVEGRGDAAIQHSYFLEQFHSVVWAGAR